MNRFIRALVAVSVVSGCAADLNKTPAVTAVGEPAGAAVTSTVGAAGGTVRSTDGKIELVVPAGALAADTALSVTPLTVTAPGGVRAYRLGPEGTTFSKPASVRFPFTDADLAGSSAAALYVAFQDAEHRWNAIKASTVDANSITVQTTHLSDWTLTLGWQLRPPQANVEPGKTVSLSVRVCNVVDTEAELVALVAECQEDESVGPLLGGWEVNGVAGGNAEAGTVAGASPTAVYTAPGKAPSANPVAVSVHFSPPRKDKVLLVSNITVGGALPKTYAGTVTYHLKLGGPGTSLLPFEVRFESTVTLSQSRGSSYDLTGGTATMTQYEKDTGITGCHCTATSVPGTMNDDTGALILSTRDSTISGLQWGATFLVMATCSGSTDPACVNETGAQVVTFFLAGMNPACTGMSQLAYTNPKQLTGNWSLACPANPQLVGRIEEATWALQGSD